MERPPLFSVFSCLNSSLFSLPYLNIQFIDKLDRSEGEALGKRLRWAGGTQAGELGAQRGDPILETGPQPALKGQWGGSRQPSLSTGRKLTQVPILTHRAQPVHQATVRADHACVSPSIEEGSGIFFSLLLTDEEMEGHLFISRSLSTCCVRPSQPEAGPVGG